MTNTPAVDPGWIPPKWLTAFNKRELQYLAFRLDASNTALRIVNRKLTAQLEETPHR